MRTEIDIMKKISESQPDNVIHFFEYFEDEANMFLVHIALHAHVLCVYVCESVCLTMTFKFFLTCIESYMNLMNH
jgi:hypothetical protein